MKLFVQCASGADQQRGRYSYGLLKGWLYNLDEHIRPVLRGYAKRFPDREPMQVLLHNPWGNFFKTMHCDAYQVAMNSGATFFVDEFQAACDQLVADGHRPMAYIGSPHNTKSINDLVANPAKETERHAAVMKCYAPAIDAGCGIGWDNFSSDRRTPLDDSVFNSLHELGIDQAIEATLEVQERNRPFWNFDQIITNELFWIRHNLPSREPRFPQAVDGDDRWYQSTVTIIVRKPETAEEFWELVNRIEQLNHLNGGAFATRFEPAITISLGKRYLTS